MSDGAAGCGTSSWPRNGSCALPSDTGGSRSDAGAVGIQAERTIEVGAAFLRRVAGVKQPVFRIEPFGPRDERIGELPVVLGHRLAGLAQQVIGLLNVGRAIVAGGGDGKTTFEPGPWEARPGQRRPKVPARTINVPTMRFDVVFNPILLHRKASMLPARKTSARDAAIVAAQRSSGAGRLGLVRTSGTGITPTKLQETRRDRLKFCRGLAEESGIDTGGEKAVKASCKKAAFAIDSDQRQPRTRETASAAPYRSIG